MGAAGFGLGDAEALAALLRVGAVEGGCYEVAGSIRATEDSLMNSGVPVARLGELSLGRADPGAVGLRGCRDG